MRTRLFFVTLLTFVAAAFGQQHDLTKEQINTIKTVSKTSTDRSAKRQGGAAEASFGEIQFSAVPAVAKAVASHRTPKAAFGARPLGDSRWFEAFPRRQIVVRMRAEDVNRAIPDFK